MTMTMDPTTATTETPAPAEPAPVLQTFTVGTLTIEAHDEAEALRTYKRMVRAEAMKAQADQNWCNSGTNERLRILGLREVGVGVPLRVTVTGTRVAYLSIDAEDRDEALEIVRKGGPDVLAQATALVGRGWTATAVEVESTDPLIDETKARSVGDPDDTLSALSTQGIPMPPGLVQCEQYHNRGYYCTMPRGHQGQHVAGDGRTVRHVWRNNLGSRS